MVATLAITPLGHLRCIDVVEDELAEMSPDAPDLARASRLSRIGEDVGLGLLQLATVDLTAGVSPSFSWAREIGRAIVQRACTSPELLAGKEPIALDEHEALALVQAVPPMPGAEYVTAELVHGLSRAVDQALRRGVAKAGGLEKFLASSAESEWHVVGRVCFHLGENKRDPERPFAFLATFAKQVAKGGRLQHVPLAEALRAQTSAKGTLEAREKEKLRALLEPVERAAEKSELLRAMVTSGEIYQATAWTVPEAMAFLRELPALEASGVVVRLPASWRGRRPPRPRVTVTVGEAPSSDKGGLGVASLVDFDVALTLEGEALSRDEIARILAATEGLVLVKGRWVEVDPQQISAVIDRWKDAARTTEREGVTFAEAMRLLSGVPKADGATNDGAFQDVDAGWSKVIAGEWLSTVLGRLREPSRVDAVTPGEGLAATLRPYQTNGVRWLWLLASLGLGACLADDMGLGKTVQLIALLVLLRRDAPTRAPDLLVVPASLIPNWCSELKRFAPQLRVFVAHPSANGAKAIEETLANESHQIAEKKGQFDVVITTYGTLSRSPALFTRRFGLLVLDEAQAIKNPGAKQTRAVKTLDAAARIALTGTPVENRLGDLWSLFDFLNPGLLGSAKSFGRLVKQLGTRKPDGYAPLRALVQPYILRRLKSDRRVIDDLPDKTEVHAYCPLSKPQAALYRASVDELAALMNGQEAPAGIERRGAVLAFLLRFKQICNHPSQWLGDGVYAEKDSGKLLRLRELCEPIAARQEKVLVFTQFREMCAPLASFLAGIFGRPGVVLTGETAVKKRKDLVDDFQREDGAPFFVLSLKAGGTGLNLTAASHVVHFDRWWNPAVENQATDRAYRIGQKKNVLVHKFVCPGTLEERIDALITSKKALSTSLLGEASEGAEAMLTEMSNDELLAMVSLDARRALGEEG